MELKYQITPLRSQTLTDAYWLTKDVEPCHPPQVAVPKKQFVPYNNFYQKSTLREDHKQTLANGYPTPNPTTTLKLVITPSLNIVKMMVLPVLLRAHFLIQLSK